jgi:N-acetylmuramoyl-L-alanine amidase
MKHIIFVSLLLLAHLGMGSVPISTQKQFIIVIDAGHGGKDPGAVGKKYKEKDLALKMSLKLGQLITNQDPNIKVIYTRNSDVFIPLYKRSQIANQHKADLFVSIHCNYISNPNTKGTETFVLGTYRADDNFEIARRENDVVLLETNYEDHYDGFDPNSPLGHIVLSSVQNSYLNQSLTLGQMVEENFSKIQVTKSRGVKQAGFAVLRRTTMPSILVETGFLSNTEEENFLGSEIGQHNICLSLNSAIFQYISTIVRDNKEITKNIELVSKRRDDEFMKNQIDKITSQLNLTINELDQKSRNKSIHPFPVKNQNTPKKTYKVQIAALKNRPLESEKVKMERLGKLHEVYINGIYKYQIGDFEDYAAAEKKKITLKEAGYHTTFIIEELLYDE